MIRDRGRIKWTAMMLPEHVKMLRDWVKEDGYEQKKELDEQQLEYMNDILSEAKEVDHKVTITHFRNLTYEMVIGKIHHWDEINRKLRIMDQFEEIHQMDIDSIVDIRLTE
jgi:broad-specificity NMP kinase